METEGKTTIKVESTINAPVEKVWEFWTKSEHITEWNQASDDWHAPYADNDLRVHGKFKTTMAARDGSFSFDFEGTYTSVKEYSLIEYIIADGRNVKISFVSQDKTTRVTETFEAENTHSTEMQRSGWQAILDNFKKYTESH